MASSSKSCQVNLFRAFAWSIDPAEMIDANSSRNSRVVLSQIALDRDVPDELRQIPGRDHEVQHIVPVPRLDALHVLLQGSISRSIRAICSTVRPPMCFG